MTNELLELWRKEAEDLYNTFDIASQRAYIEGCKVTHEKMQKEADRLYQLIFIAFQFCNFTKGELKKEKWEQFKKENDLL